MNETNVSFYKKTYAIDKEHKSDNTVEKRNDMSDKIESKPATTTNNKLQKDDIYQLLLREHFLRTYQNKELEWMLQEQRHRTSSSSTTQSSSKVCKKTQEERITDVTD